MTEQRRCTKLHVVRIAGHTDVYKRYSQQEVIVHGDPSIEHSVFNV